VPRLELSDGVPDEGRTLCVIPALLTKPEDAEALVSRLEEFRLCNHEAGGNLAFGLLADLPESRTENPSTILCSLWPLFWNGQTLRIMSVATWN
jgi:hypothetical protein